MSIWRWPQTEPPEDLGAVVHGPVLLARTPGIGAGLRCVTAHPGILVMTLVVRARDVWAEAAGRQSFDAPARRGPGGGGPVGSDPQLMIGIDDRLGIAHPYGTTSTGGGDAYSSEATYVVGAFPRDGVLRLVLSWPQVGLPETTTEVHLVGLEEVADRVVTLLT